MSGRIVCAAFISFCVVHFIYFAVEATCKRRYELTFATITRNFQRHTLGNQKWLPGYSPCYSRTLCGPTSPQKRADAEYLHDAAIALSGPELLHDHGTATVVCMYEAWAETPRRPHNPNLNPLWAGMRRCVMYLNLVSKSSTTWLYLQSHQLVGRLP